MKRRIRFAAIAMSASLAVVLVSCANKVDGVPRPATGAASSQPQPSAAGGKELEFADQVCGATIKFFEPALAMVSFRPDVSNPGAAIEPIKGALRTLSAGLESALSDLVKIDTSSVEGADKIVNAFTEGFSQLKQKINASVARLDSVNPNDPQAATAALQEVGANLRSAAEIQRAFESMGDTSRNWMPRQDRHRTARRSTKWLTRRPSRTRQPRRTDDPKWHHGSSGSSGTSVLA